MTEVLEFSEKDSKAALTKMFCQIITNMFEVHKKKWRVYLILCNDLHG